MSQRPLAATWSLLALAASLHASQVQAQTQTQAQASSPGANRLDTVVTTATRTPQRLAEVLADLTVFTRADITAQAAASVGDLMRNNGIVEMSRNGGAGATTSLFLRGAETRHTLVLVDGVRVDSQATGGASWNAIPIAQVERVEVLKGPASAIYGSDAIGGVVQIFTRQASATPSVELGLALGNLGTSKLDGGVSGRVGTLDYAVSLAAERSSGFNATLPSNIYSYVPDRDGYRKRQASLRLGNQFNAQHRAELVLLKSHVDAQYDGDASQPLIDDHALQDSDAARLAWTAQWLPALQTQLSYGESRDRYDSKPESYLTETRIRNLALTGSYLLDARQQLTFTAERIENRLQSDSLLAVSGIDRGHQNAIGAGYLLNLGGWGLQAHARHDADSQFGSVNTGTVLAGYLVAPGLRVVGSIGNAFRTPTLFQRGSIYGPDLSRPGVQALTAERGHNLEVGLKYGAGDLEASATAYRNRVSNLIIFAGDSTACNSGFGCYQNVSQALLQGLSLKGSMRLGPMHLSATLDLQAPKDASTGLLLPRRAQQFGTVRAGTEWAGWQLGAAVQASGRRFDDPANTQALGGYALLNLDAGCAINREWRLQLNVDNAFNRAHETARTYASTPRTVLLGLRYSPAL